tara:strand:+ start:2052 stop:2309 length:258 start_codon:yes stop_codon:yes gene_type:complete
MKRIEANYWKVEETKYKLQLRTRVEQSKLEEALPGWSCVSYGYIPNTEEDLYIFEREFSSEFDWTNFLKSDKINTIIEMKEVVNE